MASISVAGDSSGSITIAAPAVAGSGTLTLPVATDTLAGIAATQTLTNKTLTAPVLSGSLTGTYTLAGTPTISSPSISSAVMTTMASSVITSGTAVASTSGTSIDFTGIPSWVKRITVMFSGVSTSGTSLRQCQLGAGSITTTGYTSTSYGGTNGGPGSAASSAGILFEVQAVAALFFNAVMTINNFGSNTWVASSINAATAGTYPQSMSTGAITLGGTLDRVRITTVNGTDTFDAGSVNILYE